MIYQTNSGSYELNTLLIDLNGTLTVYGTMNNQTKEYLAELRRLGWRLVLLTGNQRGNVHEFEGLGLELVMAKNSDEKRAFALTCDVDKVVAVGNARIDIGMFQVCKLRIATLQAEGIHCDILKYVDIVVPSFESACKLLLDEAVFAATMKV